MLGSNLLDVIPCYVIADNISNCNKAEYISDVGSNRGLLEILGVKFSTLHQRIVLPMCPTFKYIGKRQVDKT